MGGFQWSSPLVSTTLATSSSAALATSARPQPPSDRLRQAGPSQDAYLRTLGSMGVAALAGPTTRGDPASPQPSVNIYAAPSPTQATRRGRTGDVPDWLSSAIDQRTLNTSGLAQTGASALRGTAALGSTGAPPTLRSPASTAAAGYRSADPHQTLATLKSRGAGTPTLRSPTTPPPSSPLPAETLASPKTTRDPERKGEKKEAW